jgi:uncharacterized YigZ family protein
MKSIVVEYKHELIIKKSLFITYLFPVRNVDKAKQVYQRIKDEHPDANHHCYAYIIGEHQEHQKYFDDGEPNRTAGFPMLEVLLKQDLTDIMAIVVRYFGGIKLGGGGLTRAYGKSVSDALKDVRFAWLKQVLTVQITVPFDDIGKVEHFLRQDYDLINTSYDQHVHYLIELARDDFDDFQDWISEQTSGNAFVQVISKEQRYM